MKPDQLRNALAVVKNRAVPLTVRHQALEEAASSGNLDITTRLAFLGACLDDPDSGIREHALSALGRDPAPELAEILHQLISDPSEEVQALALKILAERKDLAIEPLCAHLVCHGKPKQRTAALIAAGILRGKQTVALLEVLQEASDNTTDQQVVIAIALAKEGNRLAEAFLEHRLPLLRFQWRVHVAAVLGELGNRQGLAEMRRFAVPSPEWNQEVVRFLFLRHFGIPFDASDADWTAAVLAWVDEREKNSHVIHTAPAP
jgi:HEAT repeat protein